MKVIVTGGAGFVGTNLIKQLLKDGHSAISLDNYSTGIKDNHQKGPAACGNRGSLRPCESKTANWRNKGSLCGRSYKSPAALKRQ